MSDYYQINPPPEGTVVAKRASDSDRDLYQDHLSSLYMRGLITQGELDQLRNQVSAARTMSVLTAELEGRGLPLPAEPGEEPARGRDWGMPRNFIPLWTAATSASVMVAVLPVTALAHQGDTLSNVLSAFFLVLGMMGVFVSIIGMTIAGSDWDDQGSEKKKERRERDRSRRSS